MDGCAHRHPGSLPLLARHGSHGRCWGGIHILVYDIQDNGCRSYTYISTMGLAMEAAAAKIPFVVLHRPNPLGGLKGSKGTSSRSHSHHSSASSLSPTCMDSHAVSPHLNGEKLLAGGERATYCGPSDEGMEPEHDLSRDRAGVVPTSPHQPRTSPRSINVGTASC